MHILFLTIFNLWRFVYSWPRILSDSYIQCQSVYPGPLPFLDIVGGSQRMWQGTEALDHESQGLLVKQNKHMEKMARNQNICSM